MNRKTILIIAVCVFGVVGALLVMTAGPPSQRGPRPTSSWSVTYTPAPNTTGVNFSVTSPLPASNAAAASPTNPPAK